MKKILVLVVLLVLFSFCLTSCVPADNGSVSHASTNTSGPTDKSIIYESGDGRVSVSRIVDDEYGKICYVVVNTYSSPIPSIHCLDK